MNYMKEQEKSWTPNKDLMLDSSGKPLTQSLFLETTYSDSAIYSLKDDDYIYKEKYYPSIKRLYLEMEDISEYAFANKYFLGWDHWKRIAANKLFTAHVESWRNELNLKLVARGNKLMMAKASEGNLQAIKWLADRGWDVNKVGRPSKQDVENTKKTIAKREIEYTNDFNRLMAVK